MEPPDKLYRRLIIAAIWIALIPFVGRYLIAGISLLLALFVTKTTAMTDIPAKNSVRYKKYLLRMSLFSMQDLPVVSFVPSSV